MTEYDFAEAERIINDAGEGRLDAYAFVFRSNAYETPTVEVFAGSERVVSALVDIDSSPAPKRLVVAPYCHIKERGFEVNDDGTPLRVLDVEAEHKISLDATVGLLPSVEVKLENSFFDPDDEIYESVVGKVISAEIGSGEGPNFVVKRSFCGDVVDYNDSVGLSIFRNLLKQEKKSYWTFFIRFKDVALIGASPEMHLSLNEKLVSMTPISGTYRFPASGPSVDGLREFLCNTKEEDELSMVLDEELKMMTNMCVSDIAVKGPYLIQMSQLAHVGYRLEGLTELPVHDVLKRSMFAPTVVGSPIENAARVISRYEQRGRSYYSGFAALVEGKDADACVDSAILIRTAEITSNGKMDVGVGATLVRDSDPMSEVRETAVKAAAMQRALNATVIDDYSQQDSVIDSLNKRNERLSSFWLCPPDFEQQVYSDVSSILILDNEDDFTSMMEYQLRKLGMKVSVVSYASIKGAELDELVIVGPGPGDPRDLDDVRVGTSRTIISKSIERELPFLAICFGHQVLCSLLGLSLERLSSPNQGLQKTVSVFGKQETVGFYNTFVAISEADSLPTSSGVVQVYRDEATNHVHGLMSQNFRSMQFHPESILSKDGARILKDAILSVSKKCVLS